MLVEQEKSGYPLGMRDPTPLGSIVRARRQELDWTQLDLAARLGWTGATVSRLETGDRPVTVQDLILLAHALAFPLEDLARAAALSVGQQAS